MTLLRHTTPAVEKGTCYGMTDLDLAEGFVAEAAAVEHLAASARVIVTSPLGRCRRLAQHLAALSGAVLHVDQTWREMDFGRWEGTRWDAIPRDELDGWAEDFHLYRDHGGESVAQLEARVRKGLATAPEGALIVTHMGCIKAALAIRGQGQGWDSQLPFGGWVSL
nr:histidine phosphatase family protein [Thetidibacter halocola]